MEFTRLNTSKDGEDADGAWHLVIAPRERAEEQQDGEFSRNFPRAHFLRPGSSRAEAQRDASSPCTHDLQFKAGWLHDCPWDSGCSPYSFIPHPLAQPGFYSPKIPRSKYCEPALSTTQIENTKEFYSHTLPLPRSKKAELKQSKLSCKPQGVKTSSVEKPRSMKAAISRIAPESHPIDQQQYEARFHCINDQTNEDQGFSNGHQRSPNLRRPEISKKEEFLLNHQSNLQTRSNQNTQVIISMQKCAPELHTISGLGPPQSQSTWDEHGGRLNLQTSGYYRLSLYNNSPASNQSHDCMESKEYSDVGNGLYRKGDKSQVDVTSKNVFGQPRVIATLRPACTPRTARKTTVVEDLKKLIVMDDISEKPLDDSPSPYQMPPDKRPIEELHCSASANPLLFHSPVLGRRPHLRPTRLSLQLDATDCQPRTQISVNEGLEKDLLMSHRHPPLPKAEYEWNSLVNAAEAFEMQRMADLLSTESPHLLMGSGPCSPAYSGSNLPCAESGDGAFLDLPDHLSHVEAVLRRLSSDLLKEKKDKVALLAEVLKLQVSNQHLKEESLSANAQLRKICQLFSISPECME